MQKAIKGFFKLFQIKDLVVLFLTVFVFSCSNNNLDNEALKISLQNKKERIVAPVTVSIKNPIIVKIDTCPYPRTFKFSKTLKKFPANFVSYMQNYST